ncbi:MAG: integrase core domain-containing protein [Desulfarculaceae bacterium]|nr:integrase core domain-containing protein [Desulfarculaceae bacterium]
MPERPEKMAPPGWVQADGRGNPGNQVCGWSQGRTEGRISRNTTFDISSRLWALTVIDNFTRESPAVKVGQGITGQRVVQVLERVSEMSGLPDRIFLDNGPELVSKAQDLRAYENGITQDFSRPGKPRDNTLIESFNGHFSDECLNVNWFLSLEDAKTEIETWRRDYNDSRPHTSLGERTPREFARCHLPNTPSGGCPNGPNPPLLPGSNSGLPPKTWKSTIPLGLETGITSKEENPNLSPGAKFER